jgi:hypothetical protein
MAILPDVFTPDEATSDPFTPLPADWYEAEILSSEVKSTKAKDGKYISLKFVILEGEFKDRFVFTNLNIVNKSDVAVRIAQSDLKKICDACGVDSLEDTEDLHNVPMQIKLSVKPETSQWPAKNEVKDFRGL